MSTKLPDPHKFNEDALAPDAKFILQNLRSVFNDASLLDTVYYYQDNDSVVPFLELEGLHTHKEIPGSAAQKTSLRGKWFYSQKETNYSKMIYDIYGSLLNYASGDAFYSFPDGIRYIPMIKIDGELRRLYARKAKTRNGLYEFYTDPNEAPLPHTYPQV